MKKPCKFCNEAFTVKTWDPAEDYCCEECAQLDETTEDDLGPTGHGDICMSDADPGL